jgi:hypothetical protein
LIGEPAPAAPARLPAEGEQRMVATDQVHGGALNPRKDFRTEELQELAECRWWSMDEIAASEDIFVPRRLAALLPPILRGEYPGVPIRTD